MKTLYLFILILFSGTILFAGIPFSAELHNPVPGAGFGKEFFDAHPEFSPILQVKKGWSPTILSNGIKDRTAPIPFA